MTSDEELKQKAVKITRAKSDFYIHLGLYIAVNIFLIALWWITLGPDGFPWFVFPLFGWGIGIAAHGVETFRGEGYIEKKAEEEYQKLKKMNK